MERGIVAGVILLVAAVALAECARADQPSVVLQRMDGQPLQLTGHTRTDLLGQLDLWNEPQVAQEPGKEGVPSRKSPWAAAGMSLVLPGAGQLYAHRYVKSAIFFALEVAAVTAAIVYDTKGDNQTSSYESFADQNWSVVRYGEYTEANLSPSSPPYGWLLPNTEGSLPWQRVNWAELNRMERDIGGYYSHVLPPHGEQQYYELIGKYPQYNQGWNDAPPSFTYGDPLTPNFLYYSDERGKANTYYGRASTAVIVAVANHVLSAVDAAWSASSYNSDLHAQAELRTVPMGPLVVQVPALKLSYAF